MIFAQPIQEGSSLDIVHISRNFLTALLSISYLLSYYIQSCGLCEGLTPHPSNDKCHDTAPNCADVPKKNLCRKFGKRCKKVKLLRFFIVFQFSPDVQSCGLCEGLTPHVSYTCYDEAPNCREVTKKNACHQHGQKCKKVKF